MPCWLLLLAKELATASAASPRISFALTTVVVVAALLLALLVSILTFLLLLLCWLLTLLNELQRMQRFSNDHLLQLSRMILTLE